jgi:SPIRAL1-like protein
MMFPSEQAQQFRDQRSSNAFANGSNQNCGNVITDRSSTRLHAPPGGQSSMGSLLSWDEPERAQPSRRRDDRFSPAEPLGFQGNVPSPQRFQGNAPSPHRTQEINQRDRGQIFEQQTQAYRSHLQQNDAMAGAGRTSSNSYADGSNQNCGNVLTDRRTTRVSAPPGGHSSICFG